LYTSSTVNREQKSYSRKAEESSPGGVFISVIPASWQARFTVVLLKGGKQIVAKGKVKWFSNQKGYGFITLESGEDVFVHHSVIEGDGYKSLEEGQEVEVEVQQGPKGAQAAKVVKL